MATMFCGMDLTGKEPKRHVVNYSFIARKITLIFTKRNFFIGTYKCNVCALF